MSICRRRSQITSFTCLFGKLNETNKQNHVTVKPLNIKYLPSLTVNVCATFAGVEPFLVSHMPRLLPMSPGFASCDKWKQPWTSQSYAWVEGELWFLVKQSSEETVCYSLLQKLWIQYQNFYWLSNFSGWDGQERRSNSFICFGLLYDDYLK